MWIWLVVGIEFIVNNKYLSLQYELNAYDLIVCNKK